ncbi:MAG: hypothetical protein GYB65_10615 [Chloroflexi bacterium]|nr:hypothetical protein [Chloroflexota bacterium]
MDISLITSVYRAATHLGSYAGYVVDVATRIRAVGLALEIIIVANDATPPERATLEQLAAATAQDATVRALYVPRETIYASWNRGIRAATGTTLGFWNVDDQRSAAALVEGHRLIQDGCRLVYFPFLEVQPRQVLGLWPVEREFPSRTPPFDRRDFSEHMYVGPFFLFVRDLYQQVGPFDEDFRIAGDFEWAVRAAAVTDFCHAPVLAGRFVLHGGNLSGTQNPLQQVEDNIIHLRREAWRCLLPAQPDLMRDCWFSWGSQGQSLSPEIEAQLWGPDAAARYAAWLREQQVQRRRRWRVQLAEMLRSAPRWVINRAGLRTYLARWGVVKSVAMTAQPKQLREWPDD